MKSKITKSVTIEENSKMKSITGKVASTCGKALISTPLGLSTFQAVKRLCLSDRICKGLQYDKDSKAYMLFDNFLSSFCFIFSPRCKREFSFKMNNISSEASIGPGGCINFSPTITNTGKIEGFVYFRLELPIQIGERDTPFIYPEHQQHLGT